MPHVTKIPRKPEGFVAEIKAVAFGSTGTTTTKLKSLYKGGTAVVLRLTEDVKESGCTVIALSLL
ncbi:hypothetical protein THRCLA_21018 [Thraustotheca clavata]|uniref:Uncharacterized protein n=1 Tax=Thraustotheca clavata TaxID=74557 RepID=A0A1W0A107_9STRA|nr:hypothetical protein THRCLA_21018 [Thraustotheca clavata]